jgi:hypothetical protein
MKKNQHSVSIRSIDRDLRAQNLQNDGDVDETVIGRLDRVVTVFTVIRPLLFALSVLPILPTTSRSAVTVFVAPGDTDVVEDFKAGRDL